jgi:hypothetical protein
MVLFRGPGDLGPCAAMASPFFGVGYFSAMIGAPLFRNYPSAVAAAIFWSAFYVTVAGGLLAATLLTFNRCLGRLSDSRALSWLRPTARFWRKPAPVVAEEF